MKQLSILLAVLFWLCFDGYAQPWAKNIKTENPGFYEIQAAFNEYAATREKNFKGSKQFRRWENFYESRVDADGRFPTQLFYNEVTKINEIRKTTHSKNSNWQPMGPFSIPLELSNGFRVGVGRVNCMEFHPSNPDIIWIGTPNGGVWKTIDGGNTWNTTTDDLLSIGISDIVVNPSNPDIVYIATGDRDAQDISSVGIMKSTDGGETWQTTGLSFNIEELANVNEILINPENPNILVAATNVGIYRSVDAAANWELVSAIDNFKDMQTKVDDFNIIVASTYRRYYAGIKFYRSTDGGASFSVITAMSSDLYDSERVTFANTPANPSVFYALSSKGSNSSLEGVYKSIDAGATWTKLTNANTPDIIGYYYQLPGGQSWYNLSIVVSPTNADEVVVGGVHIWKSTDGGVNYTMIHNGWASSPTWIHCDYHEFRINPINNRLYSGNDGGIYYSDNFGTDWTDISSGLQILQTYKIGVSATVEDYVVMGNQDNGSMRLKNDDIKAIFGGDGMECFIDPVNSNFVYNSIQLGDLYRSSNSGLSWSNITPPGMSGTGGWTTPFLMDPVNPEVLYAGYNAVMKSTDRGNSWTKISPSLAQILVSIDIAKTNQNILFTSSDNNIWKTEDGGVNWFSVKRNLPSGHFSDIQISPVDENMVWLTLSGFSSGKKVFVSKNGGLTWINISDNLPNVPVNCITYCPNTADGIYIGTDGGVWYRDNSMNEWVLFSNSLPTVIVKDLEIQEQFKTIIAGTFGRGIWKSNTFYAQTGSIIPEFATDMSLSCSGTIQFINTTEGDFTGIEWNFGDGTTSGQLNPKHTYLLPGTYSVTLTMSNGDFSEQFSQSVEIVQVLPLAQTQDVLLCGTGTAVLTASGPNNIYWFSNPFATNIIRTGNQYTTPYLSDSAIYYVANGTSEQCFSSLTPVNVFYHVKPTARFTAEIYTENAVIFANQSINSISYLWDFGDNTTSDLENPFHLYTQEGAYAVKLYSSNEFCVDSVTQTINTILAIPSVDLTELRVFPNPTSGLFVMEFEPVSAQDVTISISDLKGSLIFEQNLRNCVGKTTKVIDLSKSENGIYLLSIGTKSETKTLKIIRQ